MARIKKTKEIDLTKNATITEADEDKAVNFTNEKTMVERIQNKDGGTWVKYGKTYAKLYGKSWAFEIMPIEYKFQEGLKTFVLDEHYDELMRTLDKEYRAEGEPFGKDPFAAEAAGTADTSNYINR